MPPKCLRTILRFVALVYSWYFFFQKSRFQKLFDIRFSYTHCKFSHVCLLVKMASKMVTRSVKLNKSHFVPSENLKNIRLNRIYSFEYSYDIWSEERLLKIQKEIIFSALTKAITLTKLIRMICRMRIHAKAAVTNSHFCWTQTPHCSAGLISAAHFPPVKQTLLIATGKRLVLYLF